CRGRAPWGWPWEQEAPGSGDRDARPVEPARRESSSHHVHHGEDHHPHRIDEMPVPGDQLHALAVNGPEGTAPCEEAAEREHAEPDDDVGGVEPDQRKVGRAEEIGPDGEAVLVDEPVPLPGGGGEEYAAEEHGDEKPEARSPDVAGPEG